MKKLMITATLLVGLISFGFSQVKRDSMRAQHSERMVKSPEERAKMSTEALAKRLSLTDKQKQEVYAVNLERAKKMEKLRSTEDEFRKSQMEKYQSLMDDSDKKLDKILTDEQRKNYEQMRAQQKERMKMMKMHHGQPERGRMN